ncbi:MAG TPA: RNA polymerase sigma factor [Cyclobacteriaceae bacterium]|nr:RNA polymerase sigma factor [Cyclobacteriaceae bacterium]
MSEAEQQVIFETWLGQYKAMIFKIVRAYALNPMDRDDLFQDIVIQVWRSISSFRNESSPSTWIYRISLNTAIRWIKRERRHAELNESHEAVRQVLMENPVSLDDRLAWLYKEIYTLNEIDRCITILMLDDLSYKEMAGILGITESNVGVKINRIKKYLVSRSKTFEYGV